MLLLLGWLPWICYICMPVTSFPFFFFPFYNQNNFLMRFFLWSEQQQKSLSFFLCFSSPLPPVEKMVKSRQDATLVGVRSFCCQSCNCPLLCMDRLKRPSGHRGQQWYDLWWIGVRLRSPSSCHSPSHDLKVPSPPPPRPQSPVRSGTSTDETFKLNSSERRAL